MTEGIKHDQGKARYDLLPYNALDLVAQVYAMGAQKYADRNWEKGMAWGRLFAATQRHLAAFWEGEDLDKESNLPHLAHAAFGVLGLLHYSLTSTGTDDRAKRVAPDIE